MPEGFISVKAINLVERLFITFKEKLHWREKANMLRHVVFRGSNQVMPDGGNSDFMALKEALHYTLNVALMAMGNSKGEVHCVVVHEPDLHL